MGLNYLWQLGLDRSTLQEMAADLGSDIPFFKCADRHWKGPGRDSGACPSCREIQCFTGVSEGLHTHPGSLQASEFKIDNPPK